MPTGPSMPDRPSSPAHQDAPAVSHQALAELVRSELTVNHVPETITVVDEVPVGPVGKPDKQALVNLVPR